MKCLLFVILAGCAVKCDDNNYYVIEMQEDRLENQGRSFKVYWNVPTMQCKSKKIPFEKLYENYGILQNKNDSFRGEEISILYDPGLFPALLKNETSGKFKFRNGGVPQEGNLELHLETFRSVLKQSIPDPDFHGVGIIDFESWRPIFRQNFGVLVPYKDISTEIEKKMHWWWPKQWIQAEAKQRFEDAARTFMQTTLSIAKQMRPDALWGYYGFPYCFNMANNKMRETCADKVPEENDRAYWLWAESTALYPSVYSSRNLQSSQIASLIRGRVKEAERVKRKNTQVLPYFWFRYREGGYLREEDLNAALEALYKSNASGFIIWGSSNDVNTVAKCKNLREYLEKTLGPAIAAYTKPTTRLRYEMIQIPTDTTTTRQTEVPINNNDPEFNWEPPENYAQDIKNYVEEEIKRKGAQFDKVNETIANANNSVLMEIILNSLMEERNMSKNEMKGLPFVDITTDSYKQNHGKDTSQPIDVSTSISQINKDTNILFSTTESLSTELLDNKQTKVTSPESLVTKLLQNNQMVQNISSTTTTTQILPNQETSQVNSTEPSVTKLHENHPITTNLPNLETIDSTDINSDRKHLRTDFVTLDDILKNVDLTSKRPSRKFLQDEKFALGISSITDILTTELQDKHTTKSFTDGISKGFVNGVSDTRPSPQSTEDLVTKFVTKDISSTEMSTTETTHSSEELSVKIFSGEYLGPKLYQNNQDMSSESTTETTSKYVDDDNHKAEEESIAINYKENEPKSLSETTTVEALKTSDAMDVLGIDAENLYQPQNHTNSEFTARTPDSDYTTSNNKYISGSIDISSESENHSEKYAENIPFFNQNTFLDNTESPDAATNIVSNDKSTHKIIDNRNQDIENVSDFPSGKEESDATVSPTTDIDQVAGAGTRVSVPFKHYICVFYFYSVVKCLCAVFGMC